MDIRALSRKIKEKAHELGFDACGIARACYLHDDAVRLQQWLMKGMHGSMHYMEKHQEKRVDPTKLVEGARSVIVVIASYLPEETQQDDQAPKISKYALGRDYHFVIKRKLKSLFSYIKELIPETEGRPFVDSAPVLERAWAFAAGLGWIGKNSNLISPGYGSFVFIGTLIINQELQYDSPLSTDLCGRCTRCVDACPTGAILAGKVVDGSKCISYHTIENKGKIPLQYKGRFRNWVFGCDICQDVCPWNRKAPYSTMEELKPEKKITEMRKEEFFHLDEEKYKEIFKNTPVKRAKYSGLMRNLKFIQDD